LVRNRQNPKILKLQARTVTHGYFSIQLPFCLKQRMSTVSNDLLVCSHKPAPDRRVLPLTWSQSASCWPQRSLPISLCGWR